MSFYRKYRPQVISEVDNVSVREKLTSLLSKPANLLPHAFLFVGPKGSGKTTAARLVAKIFNCQNSVASKRPCGDKCQQCRSIAENTNIDVLEIDAASNRGIDEIRTLRERISLTPVSASYKAYIIDEVHMLTSEAFNALLKTLEEPPRHAVFVLATTEAQKVPATIKSRCLIIHFTQAQAEELLSALKRIVRREKLTIDETALSTIVSYADGSFRDAVKLLEQVSFHQGKITPTVVRSILAVSEEKLQLEFLDNLAKKDAKQALTTLGEVAKRGNDSRAFLVDCLNRLQTELVGLVSGAKSQVWTLTSLKDVIRKLSAAYVEMKGSPIAQLPLELAVVEFCQAQEEIALPPTPVVGPASQPVSQAAASKSSALGMFTLERFTECWKDFIDELKPYNHSVAGVLRSSRPKSVGDGTVIIEAFYKFHQEKLSELKTREMLAAVIRKLFGEKVKVEIVLGKK